MKNFGIVEYDLSNLAEGNPDEIIRLMDESKAYFLVSNLDEDNYRHHSTFLYLAEKYRMGHGRQVWAIMPDAGPIKKSANLAVRCGVAGIVLTNVDDKEDYMKAWPGPIVFKTKTMLLQGSVPMPVWNPAGVLPHSFVSTREIKSMHRQGRDVGGEAFENLSEAIHTNEVWKTICDHPWREET